MRKRIFCLLLGIFTVPSFATEVTSHSNTHYLLLQQQPSFFRFSFDDIKMPKGIQNTGLLGVSYIADITSNLYGGIGTYGSITGTQGGLFVLGVAGGFHKKFFPHWWGDLGLFVGGGGGRASYVGGGLMLRPHVGIAYDWEWARLGLHYSYVDFPSGLISSSQVGMDLNIPWNFYYVSPRDYTHSLLSLEDILLPKGQYLDLQRNDFALLLQAYRQPKGTKNVNDEVQDGTIGLVGVELDHYFTDNIFWSLKASGAFSGNPNGYMDVLGGLGYHWVLGQYRIALVPQLNAGAGGGGNVDTGGGVLIQPTLSVELPISSNFATRFGSGYLWAPQGKMKAVSATGEIVYHLDIAKAGSKTMNNLSEKFDIQDWRIELFNQTYLHPQRTLSSTTSAINLVVLQFDQLFTQSFFFAYRAASAYSGNHAGGYATGMIGPGFQTYPLINKRVRLFTEVLVGAGGGGGLALGGGELIEPVVGLHYAFTPTFGLQTSVSQIKAIHHHLNTTAINLGLTLRFGMLEKG